MQPPGRRVFIAAVALFVVATVLGGGGAGAPLHNLLIQAVALAVLVSAALQRDWSAGAPVRLALCFMVLVALTPVLQLVPLPPSWWSALPGRGLLAEADRLLDGTLDWRPLSMDPEATWLSAAYLLAPVAAFLVGSRLSIERRWFLAKLIAAGAMLSLVLGLCQLALGGGALHLYSGSHSGFPTGFFANRNQQADFLLIGMLFAAALIGRNGRRSPAARWSLWLAVVIVFSAGVIATTSRMGFLLLPLAIFGAVILNAGLLRGRTLLIGGAVTVAALVLIAMSAGTDRLVDRFDGLSDVRLDFWADSLFAIREYFPWGAGLGTFDLVYRSIENLDRLGPFYVNHAHNDYFELLIEAGLWGAILIVLFLALFAWAAFRRVDRGAVPLRLPAVFSILILLLHSIVDYPLRMLSLLTLFGFLCALLFERVGRARSGEGPLKA